MADTCFFWVSFDLVGWSLRSEKKKVEMVFFVFVSWLKDTTKAHLEIMNQKGNFNCLLTIYVPFQSFSDDTTKLKILFEFL